MIAELVIPSKIILVYMPHESDLILKIINPLSALSQEKSDKISN